MKDITNSKTRNRTFSKYSDYAVWCTAESNCTMQSQNKNLWESLVAFIGTIKRNPLGVNTSVMKKKIWRRKKLFAKSKILTPWCDAQCGVEFFELCDQISWRYRNRIWKKTLACLSGAQMVSNHDKKLSHMRVYSLT